MLVGAVLLQPGKTDAGALFTSNISSSALTPRGTTTILSKITIAAAVVFMISALLISMPAFNGNVSVLSANPETPAEAPASTANSNTNSAPAADANVNAAAPEANANAAAPAANTNEAPAANK
ncbi:MAG: preprotein translocase subunit SecG [Acidobacteria bacterium]|nr:preprotein translocase subunit SecG [Acidobacteriota bacterium]